MWWTASSWLSNIQSSRLTDVPDEEAAGVVFILELVHSFHHDLNGQALLGGRAGTALLTLHCVLVILPVVHADLLCWEGRCSARHPSGVRGAEIKDKLSHDCRWVTSRCSQTSVQGCNFSNWFDFSQGDSNSRDQVLLRKVVQVIRNNSALICLWPKWIWKFLNPKLLVKSPYQTF